ncbi:MAG: GGDEF domain-containing protein [Clostridiales bacterium]|nr:GGDEF domain-containing protein [Clostridiales bacterium]
MDKVAPADGMTVCVMMGDVSHDYAVELMNGINDAAERLGVQLFYMSGMQRHAASTDPDQEMETASRYNIIYDYAWLVGANAYIISFGSLSGFTSDAAYQALMARFEESVYVALQKEIDTDRPGKSYITIDNYNSFCRCIEHLVGHHHYRKLALVSGPRNHPEAMERERAFRDTLARHGIALEEGMVVYGDFSGFVEAQVEKLLTDHPDLEAIAFGNDEMAKTGYQVCTRRGLKIGKDIALTGFDNLTAGRILSPPLTTVSQNTYATGKLALQKAAALAMGEQAAPAQLTTSLVVRNSCGCAKPREPWLLDPCVWDDIRCMDDVLQHLREDLLGSCMLDGREALKSSINRLLDQIALFAFSKTPGGPDEAELDAWLAVFAQEVKDSAQLIAECLHQNLLTIQNHPAHIPLSNLRRILLYMEGYLFSHETREAARRLDNFRAQVWFMPEFIRDLVVMEDEDEGVFRRLVGKLRGIGFDNFYICLLPKPRVHGEPGPGIFPDKLLLAAYLSGSNLGAYPRSRMPVIDRQHPLRYLPHLKSTANMISFSIFSGDVQYGLLLCETNRDQMPLLHMIGLQIGMLVNFLELKGRERAVGKELELIRERNEILNFLSEYDTLTNIYNRRGFIERAIHLNRDHPGKKAYCVFVDLDHLKEINDTFGHSAGDKAICVVSDVLKDMAKAHDLIARLGGDEFVGIFITEQPGFEGKLRARLQKAFEEYNRHSPEPFYVEVSMGIAAFTCGQGLEISKIINEADRNLYEEKKKRRLSAIK